MEKALKKKDLRRRFYICHGKDLNKVHYSLCGRLSASVDGAYITGSDTDGVAFQPNHEETDFFVISSRASDDKSRKKCIKSPSYGRELVALHLSLRGSNAMVGPRKSSFRRANRNYRHRIIYVTTTDDLVPCDARSHVNSVASPRGNGWVRDRGGSY